MKIVLISGSPSKKSKSFTALKTVALKIEEQGGEAIIFNLEEKPLPFFSPHKSIEEHGNENLDEFMNVVRSASGFVLASPVYHGGYSGLLKNALDFLDQDALKLKAAAIITSGGGLRTAAQPTESLMTVISTLEGYAMSWNIAVTKTDFEDHDGTLTLKNQKTLQRCDKLVTELLAIATKLQS